AADPVAAETALNKTPADVELFRTNLRMGETVETIAKSQAWKQIWTEPAVQELWKKAIEAYMGEGGAPLRKLVADPANAELPALLADLVSNEIFMSSGAGTGDVTALLGEMGFSGRFAQTLEKMIGGADPNRARIRALLETLTEKPERIRIPDML